MSPTFLMPLKAESEAILEPRSKPVNLAFERLTGPVITSLSTGPLMAKFALRAPCFRDAPEGRVTPSAGNTDSKSEAAMF